MNNVSSPTTSETDWARIDAMQDEDIDFSDLPEITEPTETQIARSKLRFGGVEVESGKALTEYIYQHPLQRKSA